MEALHRRPKGQAWHREDVALHQQYMADVTASTRRALDSVDPAPYFVRCSENTGAAVKCYLDAIAAAAAAPVIANYTGVLAAADVFTAQPAVHVIQSIRLDFGYRSRVHP